MFRFWLPPATKVPRGRPSPCRGAEDNGKKTGRKLVCRDKGSLTEQQNRGNSNNNDTDKEKIRPKLAQQTLSPGQDRRRALPSRE